MATPLHLPSIEALSLREITPSPGGQSLTSRAIVQRDRTLELADAFLAEVRRDLERATAAGCDLPPRLRSVHVRAGHATPEYRTLAIPADPATGGGSPEVLSALISRYAVMHPSCCLMLAMDGLTRSEPGGEERPVLIAEARDSAGTRVFWMQPFRVAAGRIAWEEPSGGGWQDPDDQELILDGAFAAAAELPLPRARG